MSKNARDGQRTKHTAAQSHMATKSSRGRSARPARGATRRTAGKAQQPAPAALAPNDRANVVRAAGTRNARQRAEEALRESEARFRAAFESAATGMMLISSDGHPFQVNPALVEMLGYSAEELCALTFADFTCPDDLDAHLMLFRRALAGEIERYQVEQRFLHQQGYVMWGHVSAGVVRDAASQARYLVAHVEDVTERKRLEQERETARAGAKLEVEQLDRILEQMADGLSVYDAQGRLVRTNAAQRRILGLDAAPPGVNQMPLPERIASYDLRDREGHPLAAEQSPLMRALRGELTGGGDVQELQVRSWDGRDLVVIGSAAPLRDRDGRIVGAVGIIRDQTERKRLEREREEAAALAERQAEELDRVFEAVADGLIIYDQVGREVRVNAAMRRLMGLDAAPPEYSQLSLHERMALFAARDEQGRPLAPDEGPLPRALAGELMAGAETMDIRSRTLDGREVELSVSAAPLRDRAGQLVGAVCSFRDQTERKRLEREREQARANELALREVNWRMDAFLAIASHDVRAPITITVGALQAARSWVHRLVTALHAHAAQADSLHAVAALPDLAPWSELVELGTHAQEAVIMADQSVDRLSHLVQLLFDSAQARAGRLELHCEPADLMALVRQQVEALRLVAPGRLIALEPPDMPALPVLADAARIGQVLTNYVTNALKYSPRERPIEVRVQASGGLANVAVRDQGPGLPLAEQALVWQMFHRAPGVQAQSEVGQILGLGLGLGLHICKQIIEGHGGQVGVESELGNGSTFWFTLPLADASIMSPNAPASLRGAE